MHSDNRCGEAIDDNLVTLRVLDAVEENAALTQRKLAQELGVALGLAHAYLRRCVTKGFVKISQAPRNRYAYYLTPVGFAEKSRLTAEFLTQSFRFFRLAKEQVSSLMDDCLACSWTRLALAGGGEVAEIAVLCAASRSVQLVALLDTGPGADLNLPVVTQPSALAGRIDAVLVTGTHNAQQTYDALCREFPRERILAPRLLKIRRSAATEEVG